MLIVIIWNILLGTLCLTTFRSRIRFGEHICFWGRYDRAFRRRLKWRFVADSFDGRSKISDRIKVFGIVVVVDLEKVVIRRRSTFFARTFDETRPNSFRRRLRIGRISATSTRCRRRTLLTVFVLKTRKIKTTNLKKNGKSAFGNFSSFQLLIYQT